MLEYNITCPLFPGFYHSGLDDTEENPDYLYSLCNEPSDLPEYVTDALNNCWWEGIDYTAYHNAIAESFCDFITDILKDEAGFPVLLKFEKVVSPRFYNFETDKAYCLAIMAETTKQQILDYIGLNLDSWSAFIEKRHSTRDGYVSWVSNDGSDWLNVLTTGEANGRIDENEAMDEALVFIVSNTIDTDENIAWLWADHDYNHEIRRSWSEYIDNAKMVEYLNRELPEDKQIPEGQTFWGWLASFEKDYSLAS